MLNWKNLPTLSLLLSGAGLTVVLGILEFIKMRVLEVPPTISLFGIDAIVSILRHFGPIIGSGIGAFGAMLGVMGVIVMFVALIASLMALLVLLVLMLAFLSYWGGLQALRGAVAAPSMANRLIKMWTDESYLSRIEAALTGRKREIQDATQRLGPTFTVARDRIGDDYLASLHMLGRVTSLGLGILHAPSKRDTRSQAVARLCMIAVICLAALSGAVAWTYSDVRAMWGHNKPDLSDVPVLFRPQVWMNDWSRTCHLHDAPWFVGPICTSVAWFAGGFPKGYLTIASRHGADATQLNIDHRSATGTDPFRTTAYFYLGDFGEWAFLADADQPDRRILIRRAAILEFSQTPVAPPGPPGVLSGLAVQADRLVTSFLHQLPPRPWIVVARPDVHIQHPVDLTPLADRLQEITAHHKREAQITQERFGRIDRLLTHLAKQRHQEAGTSGDRNLALFRGLRFWQWSFDLDMDFSPRVVLQTQPADGSVHTTGPASDFLGVIDDHRIEPARFVIQCGRTSPKLLDQLTFGENRVAAPPDIARALAKIEEHVADRHAAGKQTKLLLLGSASLSGHPQVNLAISERRAEYVGRAISRVLLGAAQADPVSAAHRLRNTFGLTVMAYGVGERNVDDTFPPRSVQILDCSNDT